MTELKPDRKVAYTERLVGSKGRPCPLCRCHASFLVSWRFYDADTGQVLDNFLCCEKCNNTTYRSV